MFKYLLISKYLRRKLAPLFAAASVGFCTFMVIVVLSVMGGFLTLLKTSAQKLTGDVVISSPSLAGFAGYEELALRLKGTGEIERVTPVIDGLGLLDFGQVTQPVVVQGVRMEEMSEIVALEETLLWDQRDAAEHETQTGGVDLLAAGKTLVTPEGWSRSADGAKDPAMVIGVEAYPWSRRDEAGQYVLERGAVGQSVKLTVAALADGGTAGAYRPTRRTFAVVNEFKSGLYDVDKQTVFVPFDWLQEALEMHTREVYPPGSFDERTGRTLGDPEVLEGRASRLVLGASGGVSVDEAAAAATRVVEAWAAERKMLRPLTVQTWEQVHGQLIGAVQNEVTLVTFLFSVISMVAVVMVALTFYMIVLEKTRDIGVLRAIGAGRGGVMGLFVGYGLVIGIVGAVLGVAAAVGLVTHLNELQDLITSLTGWKMWNAQTYFFDRIPDEVDPVKAAWVMVGAVVSSVVGSLIPAWLASRLSPVDALRYE